MKLHLIKKIVSHQPLRFAAKSIRNIFFPSKVAIDIKKTIAIEVSSICNARCIFCSYKLGYRSRTMMKLEDFRRISKSAIKLGYECLDLTSPGGELFMHKDAIKIIRTAKDAGFKHIGTFTNGTLIYKYNIEDLLNSGIDALLISFPGFTDDIYEEIFGAGKFKNLRNP